MIKKIMKKIMKKTQVLEIFIKFSLMMFKNNIINYN